MRTDRVDPASLPAAGLRSTHDSGNEDYRWMLSTSSIPHKKLQKSETLRPHPSESYHPPAPLNAAGTRISPHKPDRYYIDDIQSAAPTSRPGLTLLQPLSIQEADLASPSRQQHFVSGSIFATSPAPAREVNPLSPTYNWPTSPSALSVYPLGRMGADAHGGPTASPPRAAKLDTSDISGARPTATIRARKDPYSSLDYSDVTGPSSPVRQRMLREGREQQPAIDTRRLGIWAGAVGGDPGRFLSTHRTATDPNRPTYTLHGRTVMDDSTLGRSRQLVAPANMDMARRSWQDPGQAGLVPTMERLGGRDNQNIRSPLRMGVGRNLTYKDQLTPAEVVAALV
mmetsp:Transcript_23809/g.52195  ORF Transcript_23809/g.52195 Transcript_23809/m.52195 type:complete len:341 (+) Transcript_23809:81-1103(+)